MGRIEKSVFVSYRRTNASWALAIFQDLTQRGFDVFFDFYGISSGDFRRVILENIRARAHFLVLLTPSALERCHDPSDPLREEIEAALDCQRNIVPLMLDGFNFAAPAVTKQLTGKLAALRNYNALYVPVDYFSAAMDRLRDRYLNIPLDLVIHPVSEVAGQTARDHQAGASSVPPVSGKDLTAEEWFERGFQASDLEKKLRYYGRAIRRRPDYPLAFNNRGLARKVKGDFEGALQDCNEAIRLKPDFAEAYNNRGVVRKERGDTDGAIADYDRAIQLKPNFPEAYNNRGNVRSSMGDLDGAIADHSEAIRLKPERADAYVHRGFARCTKGDLEGAIADYDEALRLHPKFPEAFNNRGAAREAKGDLEGALQDYTEAIRLNPSKAVAFLHRGDVLKAKGNLEGALQDYNEAVRLRPDLAEALRERANAAKLRGPSPY